MIEFLIKLWLLGGIWFLFLCLVLLPVVFIGSQFFRKPNRARKKKKVPRMISGIYIRHGMTVDQETGLVSSSARPSETAYHKL